MKTRGIFGTVAAVIAIAVTALAADWTRYDNARYQYSIAIPPGFSAVAEAQNGDGGVSTSTEGHAELRIWGSYLTERDFKTEIGWRIGQDKSTGWAISYDKRSDRSASWSGSNGDRILYSRAIAGCDGAASYFSIEYDRDAVRIFDPVIARLVKSLKSAC